MSQDVPKAAGAAMVKLRDEQMELLQMQQQKQREAVEQFWSVGLTEELQGSREPPSVLTSEVYNEAEVLFTMLENKEKLISFLDCTTVLRGMGMNPTGADMDVLRSMMAEPVMRLEQWRREEELRSDLEKGKEAAKEKKRSVAAASQKRSQLGSRPPSTTGADQNRTLGTGFFGTAADQQRQIKISPAEEIKNIDWNIFISCVETMYRDRYVEQSEVASALRVFDVSGCGTMLTEELIRIVTTNGDSVLTPTEVRMLRELLPDICTLEELAARIQGTHDAAKQVDLEQTTDETAEIHVAAAHASYTSAPADPLSLL